MDVSANILSMALSNNSLRQLNLKQAKAIATITLTTKKSPAELSIYRIFMDPSGKHSLITTEQGDNFYLYDGWTKAKQLTRFRMVIESVGWNQAPSPAMASKPPSTREILLGARNGTIYETYIDAHDDFFKSQDRYLQSMYTLPDKQPISGLRFETFPGPDAKSRRGVVIVTSTTRIYQFAGALDKKDDSGKIFESLFEPYRSAVPPSELAQPLLVPLLTYST